MKKKSLIFWSLIPHFSLSIAQINSQTGSKEVDTDKVLFRYTNLIIRDTAISTRDHYIIKVGNKWYCTGASNPYPYSQTFESWELTQQMGYEPIYYKNGRFSINGTTWTEQTVKY